MFSRYQNNRGSSCGYVTASTAVWAWRWNTQNATWCIADRLVLRLFLRACSTQTQKSQVQPHGWRCHYTGRYRWSGVSRVLLNKSFQTVALRTQISIFTSSREKMKVVKGWKVYSRTSLKSIDKCLRYGHFKQGWWCDALLLLAPFNNFIGTYPNGYHREAPYGKD